MSINLLNTIGCAVNFTLIWTSWAHDEVSFELQPEVNNWYLSINRKLLLAFCVCTFEENLCWNCVCIKFLEYCNEEVICIEIYYEFNVIIYVIHMYMWYFCKETAKLIEFFVWAKVLYRNINVERHFTHWQ